MNASDSTAWATSASGPLTTIQDSLSCGSPRLFDKPPSVNVSPAERAANVLTSASGASGYSRNTSSTMSGIFDPVQRREHLGAAGSTQDPVRLFEMHQDRRACTCARRRPPDGAAASDQSGSSVKGTARTPSSAARCANSGY